MTYNQYDKIYYGTLAERDAATDLLSVESTKFYVYGDASASGVLYISDGTICRYSKSRHNKRTVGISKYI